MSHQICEDWRNPQRVPTGKESSEEQPDRPAPQCYVLLLITKEKLYAITAVIACRFSLAINSLIVWRIKIGRLKGTSILSIISNIYKAPQLRGSCTFKRPEACCKNQYHYMSLYNLRSSRGEKHSSKGSNPSRYPKMLSLVPDNTLHLIHTPPSFGTWSRLILGISIASYSTTRFSILFL